MCSKAELIELEVDGNSWSQMRDHPPPRRRVPPLATSRIKTTRSWMMTSDTVKLRVAVRWWTHVIFMNYGGSVTADVKGVRNSNSVRSSVTEVPIYLARPRHVVLAGMIG